MLCWVFVGVLPASMHDARAGGVRVARRDPSIGERADAAVAATHALHRLIRRQQRRRRGAGRLLCLKHLAVRQAEVGRLRNQPRRAQEADVARLERLDEPVVKLCELLANSVGQGACPGKQRSGRRRLRRHAIWVPRGVDAARRA